MNEGWICPRCGKVWAPWMPSCTCAGVTVPLPNKPWIPPQPTTGDPIPPDHYTICMEAHDGKTE